MMSLENMIAALHFHVADGNCPEEVPEIFARLLERLKDIETSVAELVQQQ
jgi:hypothetical protein